MIRHFFLLLCLASSFQAYAATADISTWTLEEKIGQMLVVHFRGAEINDEARAYIKELHVGGIIFYNWANQLDNPEQVKILTSALNDYSKQLNAAPLFLMVDQEGGRVTRLKNGFTQFPSNFAVAQGLIPLVAQYNAYLTGMELKAVGVNMNLAPVVDVNVNPNNPVIGDRSFSDSAEEVALYAFQSLIGYQKASVIAVIKHFPGHGDVDKDSHDSLPIVNKSLQMLEATELLPFRRLVPSAPVIMSAHLLVPALDATSCATVSYPIIEVLLRQQMGYQGVVMTDSLAMQGILDHCLSIAEAAIRSIEAGHDVVLLGGNALLTSEKAELELADVREIANRIIEAVKNGRISETRIDCSLKRILQLKEEYRL